MASDEPDTLDSGSPDGSGFTRDAYLDGSRIRFDALGRTSVLALVLAVAGWLSDAVAAFYGALADAFVTLFGAVGWVLSFPFERWPQYLSRAFESADVFTQLFGVGGFIASVAFVALFVAWVGRLLERLVTSAGGGE